MAKNYNVNCKLPYTIQIYMKPLINDKQVGLHALIYTETWDDFQSSNKHIVYSTWLYL